MNLKGFGDVPDRNIELPAVNIDYETPDNDLDIAADVQLGWAKQKHGGGTRLAFTGTPGLTAELPEECTPLDVFKLFFKDELLDTITEETNRYAAQYLCGRILPQHSRLGNWTCVTTDEMKVFLALVIAMGVIHKSDIGNYWSADEVIHTPFFSSHMSRNRFSQILTFLHCNDNAKQGHNPDPLYKILPVINIVQTAFRSVYRPSEHLSLDEGTVPWKGREIPAVYFQKNK